jgi:hypothetical protein
MVLAIRLAALRPVVVGAVRGFGMVEDWDIADLLSAVEVLPKWPRRCTAGAATLLSL